MSPARQSRNWTGLALAVALTFSSQPILPAIAVQQQQAAFGAVSAASLELMLRAKQFILINVHVPYEGELPQTDLFIPFDQVAEHLSELPADKATQIIVYCRSGRMSATAAAKLVELGYLNVSHLTGGMNAWTAIGQSLLSKEP